MGKILVGLNMAVDGVIDGPGPDDNFDRAGWAMTSFATETGQIIGENLANSDALLLGRATYEVFKASFAHQTDPMSMGLNNVPKYVVSNTLKAADWNNSTLISGDVKYFENDDDGAFVHYHSDGDDGGIQAQNKFLFVDYCIVCLNDTNVYTVSGGSFSCVSEPHLDIDIPVFDDIDILSGSFIHFC